MPNAEDDRLHTPSADPYWNESSSFSFMSPTEGVCGSVYFYHRPNMNMSVGGPFLWDATGEHDYDCLYWDWNSCQPFPTGADMHEFELANTLRSTMLVPLDSFDFGYDRNGCALSLSWEAIMAPVDMVSPSAGSSNEGIRGWMDEDPTEGVTTGHFQQAGRMTGSIQLGERTLAIDCYSFRDRTWGPRSLSNPPRGSWNWGIKSESSSFLAVSAVVDADPPELEAPEPIVHGWYTEDGETSKLVGGSRRVLRRGNDGRPLRQTIETTDELGRSLLVDGEADQLFRFTGYSGILDWWGLCRWTWDGSSTWGDQHEVATFDNASRIRAAVNAN